MHCASKCFHVQRRRRLHHHHWRAPWPSPRSTRELPVVGANRRARPRPRLAHHDPAVGGTMPTRTGVVPPSRRGHRGNLPIPVRRPPDFPGRPNVNARLAPRHRRAVVCLAKVEDWQALTRRSVWVGSRAPRTLGHRRQTRPAHPVGVEVVPLRRWGDHRTHIPCLDSRSICNKCSPWDFARGQTDGPTKSWASGQSALDG